MAAFAALILRESPSMKKAVSLINEIDIGRFPRLLTRILQKLHLKAESSFSEEEEEKLQVAFSLEKQDLHLVLETISFILEQAVYHNVKPAALQQQLESIHLRQDKAEAFASAWSSMGQETIEKFRQRILAPHKLETVGWQLNLQMAHSAEAKLKSPQAVLQLGVSNEDSKADSLPLHHLLLLLLSRFQSCPTLRDPIDGSPRGSPVPGILQARTLEWVAISFSNA
ncbi:COMM domain-containing protein 10 isoform X1 [Bos javanicus]|uniref:COMM domain-containing protein 10 isoform X1 n=1 Tax=Bos javanicus TaxID=9906 RepID=UPI002AA67F2A|nr:COMM domain-containing protein 10 isoform X1 [Bos javanicus]